jgi:glycosyltransferase involved in cell wall biosynthesis
LIKRIIAISNHADMLGGGEHSFLDLLTRLKDSWDILAVVPEEGELETRLEQKGIETQVASLSPIRPWHLYNILSSLIAYFNLCRTYGPALIYANGSRAAFYGGIVGRILSLPVVWHCRIADPDPYLDPILKRLSSTIIANSHATSKRFKKPFQSKVTVVHNGVDIRWLRNVSVPKPKIFEDEWKVVLAVARASRDKRHDILLSAFENVAKSTPNVYLICVGSKDPTDPEWWDYLQARTYQSSFSTRIHWLGQCSDVRPWYRSAYVCVLATENESFGRVLIEAMACGVPVIATRSGGIPEIVRHGEDGLLVTPGSIDEMTDTMEKMIKDEGLRRRLAQSAIRRAEYFDLDTHIEKMRIIFEEKIRM